MAMRLPPSNVDPELTKRIEESVARVKAMTPEEQEELRNRQRESWVRGEMGWPKPKYKMVDGVQVFDSYEDYCNS